MRPVGILSEVKLTLHLPPEKDVAMPESVEVCQQPACRTGVVPPLAAPGLLAPFSFVASTATATLQPAPGGVRLLEIDWPIIMEADAFTPKDPRNQYDVTVVDANGVMTGALSMQIVYMHIVREGACGLNAWTGAASD